MLLKRINSMNSILRSKERLEDIDFKQILLDSDIIITQTDIRVVNDKTIDIEYLIIDSINNENLRVRALGMGENLEKAQESSYEYIQKMIFSYIRSEDIKKEAVSKVDNRKNADIINRKQQKKLFAMASYDKIHSIIEPMGYTSIKDIKTADFSKILKMIKKDNIKQSIENLESIPNILLDFGKYKGKHIKDIAIDKEYMYYLNENAIDPSIKKAASELIHVFYKN